MITIESAIARIANPDGWSQEAILEAAQVLRLHVPTPHGLPPNQGSGGKVPALFPGLSASDMAMMQKVIKLDLSRDDLLVAMATALEITLRKTSRMWPEDGQADAIATVLRDKRIIFEGAR